MSLKKLFNADYFIQNIKKSKLAILLFLLVVPIFTSLLIITAGKDMFDSGFIALGGFNIFYMYITPFILSLSLFGYVYKKKSADFMGSMPISRKSVFATNTIGGIILIVLMQLITMLCTFLLFGVTKAMTFPTLVLEIFLYQTVAYIFMYTVCNLAMSISGNFITQIVVILLLLFIIPSSILFFYANNGSSILVDGSYEYEYNINLRQLFNFTAPSLITNGNYFFNSISMVKMVILSIIYICLGCYAFDHKKLESAGESFENVTVHFVVKGLTLIPFAMLLVILIVEEEWEVVPFILAIVVVYYLVYDLLTNKKTKFLINIGTMFMSLVMLFGVYRVAYEVSDNIKREVDIKDISSYQIKGLGYTDFYLSDEKITDMQMLKKLIADRNDDEWNVKNRLTLNLNFKNGTNGELTIYTISDETVKELLSLVSSKKLSNRCLVKYRDVSFSIAQTNDIINEINQYIEKEGLNKFYDKARNSSNRYLTVYSFANHEVLSMGIPIDLTDNLFKLLTQLINTRTYNAISSNPYRGYYLEIANPSVLKDYMDGLYYYGNAPEEMIQFVLNNIDKPCNSEKEYVIMRLGEYEFYTNDVEQIANIMKKYGEKQDERHYPYDEYDYYDGKYYYPAVTEEYVDEEVTEDIDNIDMTEDAVLDEQVFNSI